jgi:hypothetical protein
VTIGGALLEGQPDGWDFDYSQALDLVSRCIAAVDLNLSGFLVVTGADGVYGQIAATAAALAGATRVIVVVKESKARRRMSEQQVVDPLSFATFAHVVDRIEPTSRVDPWAWQGVDILLKCPEVGPQLRSAFELVPKTAVVALMAEPWELHPNLVDFETWQELGIKVAAPNLSHPLIDLLPQLAQSCRELVATAGLELRDRRIALLCDTPCGPFIQRALSDGGARVEMFPHPLVLTRTTWDAVVVALRPSVRPPMDINGLAAVLENARGTKLVQFSGEIDRVAARYFNLEVWPPRRGARSQLGLAADAIAPAAMIRRLVGSIKAAEAARRGAKLSSHDIGFLVDGDSMGG